MAVHGFLFRLSQYRKKWLKSLIFSYIQTTDWCWGWFYWTSVVPLIQILRASCYRDGSRPLGLNWFSWDIKDASLFMMFPGNVVGLVIECNELLYVDQFFLTCMLRSGKVVCDGIHVCRYALCLKSEESEQLSCRLVSDRPFSNYLPCSGTRRPTHPFSTAYPGVGCGSSSLSREAPNSLSPTPLSNIRTTSSTKSREEILRPPKPVPSPPGRSWDFHP